MGTKNNPGEFDCYKNAHPDEPMFVLLARDPNAPQLVRQWATHRAVEILYGRRPENDKQMCKEALDCADAMEAWRRINRKD